MKKYLLSLLLGVFISTSGFTQYTKEWEVLDGGKYADEATGIVETFDYKVVVCSNYRSDSRKEYAKVKLIKIDEYGSIEWEKIYDQKGGCFCNSIIETYDGGLVVVGKTFSKKEGTDSDNWIFKVDSRGEFLWEKKFGGTDADEIYSATETQDKGLVLISRTRSDYPGSNKGFTDLQVTKLNYKGDIIWTKYFGGKGTDDAHSVLETTNGEIVIVGSTDSKGAGRLDIWVVKLGSIGNLIWDKTFGGKSNDIAYSAVETYDGGIAVAGKTLSYGVGGSDLWIFKLDKNGKKEWHRIFGRRFSDAVYSIKETNDKNLVLVGSSMKSYALYDMQIVVMDSEGERLWEKTYGGSNIDEALAAVVMRDNSIVTAGYTKSKGLGDKDIWIQKFRSDCLCFPALSFESEVDNNIPVAQNSGENKIAVIIGVEEYEYLPNADYAERDAQVFYQYAQRLFGIPCENIYYLTNNDVNSKTLDYIFMSNGWLERKVNYSSDVIVFFAGHGAPDPATRDAYLLMHNTNPTNVKAGYSMDQMLTALARLNARSTTVFVDACFSGITRNNDLVLNNVRGPIPANKFTVGNDNMMVISASTGMQYSSSHKDQKHGLFTYYLLKGLQGEAKGTDNYLTTEELFKYVEENVYRAAKGMGRYQTPTLIDQSGRSNRILIQY